MGRLLLLQLLGQALALLLCSSSMLATLLVAMAARIPGLSPALADHLVVSLPGPDDEQHALVTGVDSGIIGV